MRLWHIAPIIIHGFENVTLYLSPCDKNDTLYLSPCVILGE
jgi:hypothetical protein